jgi:hypothetical protein
MKMNGRVGEREMGRRGEQIGNVLCIIGDTKRQQATGDRLPERILNLPVD